MIVKELYEQIQRTAKSGQDEFIAALDMTVRTLISRYGVRYVCLPGQPYVKPEGVNDEIPICEEYFPAIIDNILFMLTGDAARKTDYVEEARDAYKQVWSRRMRGARFVDRGYHHV